MNTTYSANKTLTFRNLSFIGTAMAISIISSCGGPTQQTGPSQQPTFPVDVTKASTSVVTGFDQFPAHVVPLMETELRAEVNGYITKILVADGSRVTAGQALYEIDKARYEAASVQANANFSIAEANYERVKRDLARYEALSEKDAIARQILDNTRTELLSAEAQLQATKAATTTATLNLERSVIRAPFSGVIGISQVRTGALVSAGATLINTISSTTPIVVEFQAGEKHLPYLIDLQKQSSNEPDSVVTLELANREVYPRFGRISAIDRAIDRQTGTITVRVQFDNPEELLRAGMSGTLRIRRESDHTQLVIPYHAVMEQLGQSVVYVIDDQNVAEQRVIQLGMRSGEYVVVTGGLSEGEMIVTDGLINLRHGANVTIVENEEK